MSAAFDAGFIAEPPMRAEIAAEASSEYSIPPSYDELGSRRAPRSPTRKVPHAVRLPVLPCALALVVGACAVIGMRAPIVRAAPIIAPAYAAIGLPVNLLGLDLRNVRSRIFVDGARRVLTIEGEIANLRRDANLVPPVALTVLGADGQAKYAWTTPAPKARLEAGETIAFRARLAAPPAEGADVLVRFASAEPKALPANREFLPKLSGHFEGAGL